MERAILSRLLSFQIGNPFSTRTTAYRLAYGGIATNLRATCDSGSAVGAVDSPFAVKGARL